MNGDGLRAQAQGLRPRARMALGLVLTWVLSPILSLDDSEEGRRRSAECRRLLDQALGDVEEGPAASLIEDVASADELQLEEEPDGPAGYRVDFLAALVYALRSGTGDERAFVSCFSRVESTLEFLEEAGFVDEPQGLDDQVLDVIDMLQGADSVDQVVLARLQDVMAASRDHLAGSATSSRDAAP
jgi:hypothetical protein